MGSLTPLQLLLGAACLVAVLAGALAAVVLLASRRR
jgi:type IV secretory pathway TrbD component